MLWCVDGVTGGSKLPVWGGTAQVLFKGGKTFLCTAYSPESSRAALLIVCKAEPASCLDEMSVRLLVEILCTWMNHFNRITWSIPSKSSEESKPHLANNLLICCLFLSVQEGCPSCWTVSLWLFSRETGFSAEVTDKLKWAWCLPGMNHWCCQEWRGRKPFK